MPDPVVPIPVEAPEPPPWWSDNWRKEQGYDKNFRVKFYDLKRKHLVWESNLGPQTWALMSPHDEILIGGRRGGSKSETLKAWLAMGNLKLSDDDPARYSYLNEPTYRAMVVRQQYKDLIEFIDECEDFFRPFGGKLKGTPADITFPTGAKIYFRHLGDEQAFNQSKGWGLTRIGIEELTQIPEARWYIRLFGSLRNKKQYRWVNGRKVKPLKTQIMSTTNPDGKGHAWVKDRFVKVYGGGRLIPWNTPIKDTISGSRRIFIPMRIQDNPYLMDDKNYESRLLAVAATDPSLGRQWIHGDWDAGTGMFFTEYRPDGPVGEEESSKYPWARHLIDPVELKYFWYRWGSLDLGFDHPSAAHKFCRNSDDGRIHVYDELKLRHVGSYELGVMLAQWWLPELESLPEHQITLYISPDAFAKTDATNTKAQQIEAGIKEVLGPYGALLLRYNDDERMAALRNPQAAALMFERRRAETVGSFCIALKPANNDVDAGCAYMRDLLRFRSVVRETEEQLKERLTAIYSVKGREAYEAELLKVGKGALDKEILPRVQIWRKCSGLDRCMKSAIHDEPPHHERYKKFDAVEGKKGDDELDSVRYGLIAYKEFQDKIPKSYWVADRMSGIQAQSESAGLGEITDINRLMQIQRTQAGLYDQRNPSGGGSWTAPRAASMRHRLH